MPKISIIIPHYPLNPELEEKLERCTKSLKGYDELILVVNQREGFGKAINRGLKLAKGDFLIVISNDTYLTEGELKDLCIPGTVTCPVVNTLKQEFWGCFFCLPKEVYEKVGGFDEGFELAYFEDDDLIMRLRQASVGMKFIESVKIRTEGGQTMKFLEKDRAYSANRERFIKKWGEASSNVKKY